MYDEFIDFLNSIYWEGYAEHLQESAPRIFEFEYQQFLKIYRF